MQEYLNSKLLKYIKGSHTKEEVLEIMVGLMKESGNLTGDPKIFLNKIEEREKIGSTGIGMGVAVPHARSADINKVIVAIGVLENRVNFNSLDGELVKIVAMVAAPKEQSKEYLTLLSTLSRVFRNKEYRESLMECSNQQELIEAVAEMKL
jgi:fructose-specific phosphotransferase system IIA component